MSAQDSSFIPPPFPFPERWPQLFAQQQRQQKARWLTPCTVIPVAHGALPSQLQPQWQQWRGVQELHASTPTGTPSEWHAESAPRDAAEQHGSQAGGQWHGLDEPHEPREEQEDEDEGEYEYGFVLSDEWRAHFRSSACDSTPAPPRRQQLPRSAKNKSRKAAKRSTAAAAANARALRASAAAAASRSEPLQQELQAAKTRGLARRWGRRAAAGEPPVEAAVTAGLARERRQLETELAMLFDDLCDAFAPVVWPHDPLE